MPLEGRGHCVAESILFPSALLNGSVPGGYGSVGLGCNGRMIGA